jgi:unsaturated rhamnogalacturonyl hydrolase
VPWFQRLADRRHAGRIVALAGAALAAVSLAPAAAVPHGGWSELAAQTILTAGKSAPPGAWDLETGLRLEGLEAQWYSTADGEYFEYARKVADAALADPSRDAPGRSPYADALLGQQLMLLYGVTQKPAYYAAAKELHDRLAPWCGLAAESESASHSADAQQPCIARAFLAEYAAGFQQPEDLAAIARSSAAGNATAAGAGIGSSQEQLFAIAWMAASLSDALASFPADDPARGQALAALNQAATALARYQDARSGVLHLTPGQTSSAAPPTVDWLYVYALMKGVRLGYLAPHFGVDAARAWQAALARYVRLDSGGRLILQSEPAAAGNAGVQPGLGAFLLASTEVDLAPRSMTGRGAIVLLDAWYNSQQRKNAAGQLESYHYKWNDFSNSGYSLLGHMLRSRGLKAETLPAAPTSENLRDASYYLIVSPDIPVKNPNPHYMTSADAEAIAGWVRRGGVLILMENDPPNADLEHLNLLADRFGIHFDNVLHHHILGEHVEDGRIPVAGGGPLFERPHTLYMKDTCAISLSGSATALLHDRGDVMMATARYGRGTVFAAVDPWLYNEYTDGRNNPAIYSQFDNFAAGTELVRWLIQQRWPPAPAKKEAKQ